MFFLGKFQRTISYYGSIQTIQNQNMYNYSFLLPQLKTHIHVMPSSPSPESDLDFLSKWS